MKITLTIVLAGTLLLAAIPAQARIKLTTLPERAGSTTSFLPDCLITVLLRWSGWFLTHVLIRHLFRDPPGSPDFFPTGGYHARLDIDSRH